MKEHNTFPGKTYVVTCKAGCAITDASGELDETCEPGKQKAISAPSDKLYTSEHAVVRETFKRAARVLRLFAGGVKSELPAGYLRAEFLTLGKNAINTGLKDNEVKTYAVEILHTKLASVMWYGSKTTPFIYYNSTWEGLGYMLSCEPLLHAAGDALWHQPSILTRMQLEADFEIKTLTVDGDKIVMQPLSGNVVYTGAEFKLGGYDTTERLYKVAINKADMVPCLNSTGLATFANEKAALSATAGCTIGFTLAQARKLGAHLPAGGGKLTISLPTGYEQDAAVAESLETARAKGWTLTVQTYEAEAAAATFGMRRIWVRRTQDEQGGYVDADGTRWSVEWCADMLTPDGSTPDEHGYELYRSTEAAVAYWELTPWIDPEQETF